MKPEFERFGFEEACDELIGRQIDDLVAFHETGIGEPSKIVTEMRSVIEAYCTVTYAGFFDPKDSLRRIVEKIRNGGDQHPACALLDELDQIHEFSQNHLDTDEFGRRGSCPIDLDELRRYILRTLNIVRAIPQQSSSTLIGN